jgi:hypothetical protein
VASESRYKLTVVPRVQDRIDDHGRWWRKNRKTARVSFGKALVAEYALIKNGINPEILILHSERRGAEIEVWTTQLETGHILYFTLIYNPPLPTYIRVIGVKGPGEAQPFMAT